MQPAFPRSPDQGFTEAENLSGGSSQLPIQPFPVPPGFQSALLGFPTPGRVGFVVARELVYVPPDELSLPPVIVPATRRTNWGSIPSRLESFTSLDGLRGAYAFTIHDECYGRGPEIGYDRRASDLVMRVILESLPETEGEAYAAWRILRAAGGRAWRASRA